MYFEGLSYWLLLNSKGEVCPESKMGISTSPNGLMIGKTRHKEPKTFLQNDKEL
jgi:hypothetical protein